MTKDKVNPLAVGEEYEETTLSLGVWVFIITEILFFGDLFLGFLTYQYLYTEAFKDASAELHIKLGSINTALLLTSSLTMALAVHYSKRAADRATAITLLSVTAVFGSAFLAIKGYEYYAEYQEALFPWYHFSWPGDFGRYVKLFFTLYYIMTGAHALHLTIGVCLVLFTIWKVSSRPQHGLVHVIGLYWHFVDIVWVFLYPLLYLQGRT